MTILWLLPILTYGLLVLEEGACWTYHASDRNMSYEEAERFCKHNYTHLVAIQSQEEIAHLNAEFPFNPGYYWIGIRKIGNNWTWIGTNKRLTNESKNWAEGEPNNQAKNEDCVEIYIKRSHDAGKWNDAKCSNKKVALCYTASCNSSSCSGRGECIETINNHTCRCSPGFHGLKCEHVMECDTLKAPAHGSLNCSDPAERFAWNTSCQFACEEGFVLKGAAQLQCRVSGEWDWQQPECEAVQCKAVNQPENGFVNCTHLDTELTYSSTCEFSCAEGFTLRGASRIQCSSLGEWSQPLPTCAVMECNILKAPAHGSLNCSDPAKRFAWNTSCQFACEEGFVLKGAAQLQCRVSGEWDWQQPECEAVQCKAVNQPENGFVNCTHLDAELTYSSTCEFSCIEGFTLRGTSRIQCSSLGEWSQPLPTCAAAQCEMLTSPEKGSMNCSHPHGNFAYGTTCEFSCLEGWPLNGSRVLQCGAAGNWTARLPACEAPQASEKLFTYISVGTAVTGISFLSTGFLLIWLAKRLHRKAKKFTPSSSCQSLDVEGTFQSSAHLI
uniref:E-selectin n=1 Tax=Sphenodon punctatus TaxID=8508 RepID=A0A8D0H861_SPHPU